LTAQKVAKAEAERKAKEKAAQAEMDRKRASSETRVTVHGDYGSRTIVYNGLNEPTERIDHVNGYNRSETRYTQLPEEGK
jgi:hypothetical protein